MKLISPSNIFIFVLVLAAAVFPQIVQVEIAENPLPFLTTAGTEDKTIEMSAVEFIDDAGILLLTLDDEGKDLLIVDSKTGQIKKSLALLPPTAKKPKWEALARDEEGTYYAVGSHSVKAGETDPQKLINRSRLFSFRLKTNGTDPSGVTIDPNTRVKELDITDALRAEGYSPEIKDNKVKVEGLAVRSTFGADNKLLKRELFVGLREPDSPVRVLAGDITVVNEKPAQTALRRLFTFNAGQSEGINMRLSSIEYVPVWKGFVILTSTEDQANKFHGNILWFLPDEKIGVAKLGQPGPVLVEPQKVWQFGINSKAEGITLLPAAADAKTITAFLSYDNDAQTSSLLQRILLTRWAK